MNRYPRGFIWSSSPVPKPDGFIPGPLPDLWISDDADVLFAEEGGRSVAILGICVGIDDDTPNPAEFLLAAMAEGDLFEASARLCGRFLVIARDGNRTVVMNDSTAMRTVFYRKDRPVFASHASLIADGPANRAIFRYGYPGNQTPYPGVFLLTANTYLSYPEATTRRYWPKRSIAPVLAEEAAADCLKWASTALAKAACKAPVRLALTAGLDSRTMLAVALHSGIAFETYTYGGGKDTRVDIAVARDLAAQFRLKHEVVRTRPAGDLMSALKVASYASHHFSAVAPLQEYFGSPNVIAVTANLLEIGRAFYAKLKDVAPPETAKAMAALYYTTIPKSSKVQITDRSSYDAMSEAAFESLIENSSFNDARGFLDAFDQFYMEHRMSAWHGVNMLERDFYAQAFIPFNAGKIWERLLGVPLQDRKTYAAFYSMITMADPALLEIPINPGEWPLPDRASA